jgi:excisionase family DNA binding protein
MPNGLLSVPCPPSAVRGHEREISAHTHPFSNRPKLLTSSEAADFLGISRITLAAWRCSKRHSIPFVKYGRTVKYHEADLIAFLGSHLVGKRTEGQ